LPKANNDVRIRLLNIILNYISARDWKNYDNFAENLVENILDNFSRGLFELDSVVAECPSTFFSLNSITGQCFLSAEVKRRIRDSWDRSTLVREPLSFDELFPATRGISDQEVKEHAERLDVPEDKIQDAFREYFRSRGASPIPRRGKDSVLEVADIEHFSMRVRNQTYTFVAVVKGFRSVSGARISLQDIMHQVTRAYFATHPDYVLLMIAKEPKDGVITALNQFAEEVGNPNLFIYVGPVDLAKVVKILRVDA
jgi:hypothetical protein